MHQRMEKLRADEMWEHRGPPPGEGPSDGDRKLPAPDF